MEAILSMTGRMPNLAPGEQDRNGGDDPEGVL